MEIHQAAVDELLRRRDLGLPPVQLAVQLAAQELLEHRADPRGFLQAELGEVAA